MQNAVYRLCMVRDDKNLLKRWEDRLALCALLEMQKDRKPTSSGDYQKYIDIIVNGIESWYPCVFEYVGYGDRSITKEVSNEVDNILEMYRTIQGAVNGYSEEEGNLITEKYDVRFPGFDSETSESNYLVYYSFLQRHDRESLPEVTGRHHISLAEYRQMYKVYSQILTDHPFLSLNDVKHIFDILDESNTYACDYELILEQS